MAQFTRVRWQSDATGLTRRDRQPCDYDAYLPDKITSVPVHLEGNVAADVADAEQAIVQLNLQATALIDTEALARLLLRAESVASSQIEGLEIGARRLLRAEMAREVGDARTDVTAREVPGNIDAMTWAIENLADHPLRTEGIVEVHRRLLGSSRMEAHAGRLRTEQNWIGGSGYNPCSASFVPPPPELVPDLMEDLVNFCNQDSLPAIAQAALAHAWFETLHPFVDGNGRTGRVLIQLILRRRGLAPRVLPPVSLILATWTREYIAGLTGTRYQGLPDSAEASAGINRWIALFASATKRSVEDAKAFEDRIETMRADWRLRLGSVRKNSATDLLIRALPGAPLVTVDGAARLIGRSFQATNEAIERLTRHDILTPARVGRRNRAFEAAEVIDAFTDLERRLASPGGNTRVSRPARRVPSRPE